MYDGAPMSSVFDHLPENFFAPLASPNRVHYAHLLTSRHTTGAARPRKRSIASSAVHLHANGRTICWRYSTNHRGARPTAGDRLRGVRHPELQALGKTLEERGIGVEQEVIPVSF